ncbi:MAG TPA: YkgJ family cysteine cluster protein [Phycisphaerae bacterium]|nr:YkgJ family cysteine cluster protein [Phycisphaerae bacterium]
MTANAPTFKCARCGACCTHLFVYATPEDVLREPRIAERSIRADRDGSSSLMQTQWWLARGSPCPFLTNHGCAIYPTRPHDCVAFMPGSAQCTEARETANLPPLEPLPAVAERTLADEICAAALLQQGRAAASAR